MSTEVTCQCGVRVRLPEGAGGQAFRCPKCEGEISAPVNSGRVDLATAKTGIAGVCPICQCPIDPTEAQITCSDCDQVHHDECWNEVGGCSTYGCKQAPPPSKEETATRRPLTAWGDTKKCPACGETIKSIALRCRYCKTEFETVDPLTGADLRRGVRKTESVKNIQSTIVAIFVITLLVGCAAPVMLIVSLAVMLPQRQKVAKAGPLYLVLGYSTIALSVLYSVLMLLFVIFRK